MGSTSTATRSSTTGTAPCCRPAMEWWRSQGEMLTRDYFRVEDEAGLRFWLYRDGLYDREIVQKEGKAIQPNWFMHGLFA